MICRYCLTDLERPVARRWDFTLPLETPSQNRIGHNAGSWAARNAYAKFREDFILLLENQKNTLGIPKATRKRRVIITRLYAPSKRGRKRDRANVVGGAKMLIDAMAKVGLIVDDAEEYLEDFYRQLPAGESGTRIEIEEL